MMTSNPRRVILDGARSSVGNIASLLFQKVLSSCLAPVFIAVDHGPKE
jgi:hypothetical protein